jgi:hypothetical protein
MIKVYMFPGSGPVKWIIVDEATCIIRESNEGSGLREGIYIIATGCLKRGATLLFDFIKYTVEGVEQL